MKVFVGIILTCMLAGCAFADARIAQNARKKLVGWSEIDLESCLGAPDQRSTFGDTDILTYYGNSTTSAGVSLGLPFLAGFGITGGGGGYCHATFTVKEGRVAGVQYSGETNATAPTGHRHGDPKPVRTIGSTKALIEPKNALSRSDQARFIHLLHC
jgi:hypothetical protein